MCVVVCYVHVYLRLCGKINNIFQVFYAPNGMKTIKKHMKKLREEQNSYDSEELFSMLNKFSSQLTQFVFYIEKDAQ